MLFPKLKSIGVLIANYMNTGNDVWRIYPCPGTADNINIKKGNLYIEREGYVMTIYPPSAWREVSFEYEKEEELE